LSVISIEVMTDRRIRKESTYEYCKKQKVHNPGQSPKEHQIEQERQMKENLKNQDVRYDLIQEKALLKTPNKAQGESL
jgi:hypothetical protein